MAENTPPDPALNTPASGSYGEKADIEELKRELPTAGGAPTGPPPVGAPPVVPLPGRTEGRPPGIPEGMPPALLEGGPPAPVSAGGPRPPVGLEGVRGAADDRQRRLALADYYSRLETLSPRTREWFSMVKRLLLAGGD